MEAGNDVMKKLLSSENQESQPTLITGNVSLNSIPRAKHDPISLTLSLRKDLKPDQWGGILNSNIEMVLADHLNIPESAISVTGNSEKSSFAFTIDRSVVQQRLNPQRVEKGLDTIFFRTVHLDSWIQKLDEPSEPLQDSPGSEELSTKKRQDASRRGSNIILAGGKREKIPEVFLSTTENGRVAVYFNDDGSIFYVKQLRADEDLSKKRKKKKRKKR